jgi:hypothetical protein
MKHLRALSLMEIVERNCCGASRRRFEMKSVCTTFIGILALFLSGCVTGDEITNYVVNSDGSISLCIYRSNLTSDQTGENGQKDLDSYVQKLEERRGALFEKLEQANASDVQVAVSHRASPASLPITGRIPLLNDLAAYLSQELKSSSLACTAVSSEYTRGFLCKLIRKPSAGRGKPETPKPRADSIVEIRFSLAEERFTRAHGFLLASNKRSAIFDEDALMKRLNSQAHLSRSHSSGKFPECHRHARSYAMMFANLELRGKGFVTAQPI